MEANYPYAIKNQRGSRDTGVATLWAISTNESQVSLNLDQWEWTTLAQWEMTTLGCMRRIKEAGRVETEGDAVEGEPPGQPQERPGGDLLSVFSLSLFIEVLIYQIIYLKWVKLVYVEIKILVRFRMFQRPQRPPTSTPVSCGLWARTWTRGTLSSSTQCGWLHDYFTDWWLTVSRYVGTCEDCLTLRLRHNNCLILAASLHIQPLLSPDTAGRTLRVGTPRRNLLMK